ncbi:hypothetical protein [Dokdonia sp.]|uniref:hypothetical protein n=1 Tax=Dokdonia sp. TaxID=2024995 RepID=UPI003264098A
MKNLLKLGKILNRTEQLSINGGIGNACQIFVCESDSDGCCCYDNPNRADGRGTCMNGMCCD